jgi:hypothetical protein
MAISTHLDKLSVPSVPSQGPDIISTLPFDIIAQIFTMLLDAGSVYKGSLKNSKVWPFSPSIMQWDLPERIQLLRSDPLLYLSSVSKTWHQFQKQVYLQLLNNGQIPLDRIPEVNCAINFSKSYNLCSTINKVLVNYIKKNKKHLFTLNLCDRGYKLKDEDLKQIIAHGSEITRLMVDMATYDFLSLLKTMPKLQYIQILERILPETKLERIVPEDAKIR